MGVEGEGVETAGVEVRGCRGGGEGVYMGWGIGVYRCNEGGGNISFVFLVLGLASSLLAWAVV